MKPTESSSVPRESHREALINELATHFPVIQDLKDDFRFMNELRTQLATLTAENPTFLQSELPRSAALAQNLAEEIASHYLRRAAIRVTPTDFSVQELQAMSRACGNLIETMAHRTQVRGVCWVLDALSQIDGVQFNVTAKRTYVKTPLSRLIQQQAITSARAIFQQLQTAALPAEPKRVEPSAQEELPGEGKLASNSLRELFAAHEAQIREDLSFALRDAHVRAVFSRSSHLGRLLADLLARSVVLETAQLTAVSDSQVAIRRRESARVAAVVDEIAAEYVLTSEQPEDDEPVSFWETQLYLSRGNGPR